MAAASTGRPWMRATFPTGTIDAEERASAGNTYGGNAFAIGVVWTDGDVIKLFTASKWSATSFYFEVTMKAIVGTYRARLYDVTASAAVVGSEVTTTETSPTRVRSGAISLVDGNEHRAQFGSVPGDSGDEFGAMYFD